MIEIVKKIKRRLLPNKSMKARKALLDKMPKDAICAEIGTWKGDFTKEILSRTHPRKVYLIDPYEYVGTYKKAWYGGISGSQEKMDEIHNSVCKRFAGQIANGQVEILRDKSAPALGNFNDSHFDWIYIDGNHTYEFVKEDLRISWKKLKNKGYLTGDDYGIQGWWDDGVTKAVDEFIKEKGDLLKVESIEESQFILQKINSSK